MKDVHQPKRRKFPWGRWLIVLVVCILIIAGTTLWIEDSNGPLINILPVVIFTILGVIIALFQWLFPVTSDPAAETPTLPGQQGPPVNSGSLAPIVVQVPPQIVPSSIEQSQASASKVTYRSMVAVPPPTDPRTIQQRETAVKEIYVKLTQSDTTAIVLTGIGGVGKSTLAALVYRYAEEQRRAGKGPFTAPALWLKIDSATVTMTDLVGTIFHELGRPLPDLSTLAPHNQAATLFNALNVVEHARLIVLDQFENLLDWQTGHALPDGPGIGEWLDAINSQPCTCRILLTSRPWPQGTREYPPTYMQEYHVAGLALDEGVDLLRKLGVEAAEEELRMAVRRCAGHAYALTLLASLLRNRNLRLSTFFKDPMYAQLWTGNIARNLLDHIYSQQLDAQQRKLLLAFSVYRQAVPFEAARAVADPSNEIAWTRLHQSLDALLAQHLVQLSATGEGLYQLHTVVTGYAREHFDESSEQANRQALQAAHARAAHYYRHYATEHCPPSDKRQRWSDIQPLIEATWQYCQAGQWQEAYTLIEQEGIYNDLVRWGNITPLRELYQLFPRLATWQPQPAKQAHFYNELGEIYRRSSRIQDARESFEQALAACKIAGDRREEGYALNNIGQITADAGKKEEALKYYEEALKIHKELGNLDGESTSLTNIGWAYSDLEQMDLAREKYEEALRIRREMHDLQGEARVLNSLGRVHENLEQLAEARKTLEQALKLCQQVGDRDGEGWTCNNLGRAYYRLQQKELAQSYFEKALRIRREIGNRRGEAATLNNLGLLFASLGECKHALEYYEQALPIRREVGDRSGEGKTLNYIGLLHAALGQHEQAIPYFKQALSIQRELGNAKRQADYLHNLGRSYAALHKNDLALASYLLAQERFAAPHLAGNGVKIDRNVITTSLEELRKELGDKAFEELEQQVIPYMHQMLESAFSSSV